MEIVFKLNSLHHTLNDQTQVRLARTLRQDLIQMKLSNAAKLL